MSSVSPPGAPPSVLEQYRLWLAIIAVCFLGIVCWQKWSHSLLEIVDSFLGFFALIFALTIVFCIVAGCRVHPIAWILLIISIIILSRAHQTFEFTSDVYNQIQKIENDRCKLVHQRWYTVNFTHLYSVVCRVSQFHSLDIVTRINTICGELHKTGTICTHTAKEIQSISSKFDLNNLRTADSTCEWILQRQYDQYGLIYSPNPACVSFLLGQHIFDIADRFLDLWARFKSL